MYKSLPASGAGQNSLKCFCSRTGILEKNAHLYQPRWLSHKGQKPNSKLENEKGLLADVMEDKGRRAARQLDPRAPARSVLAVSGLTPLQGGSIPEALRFWSTLSPQKLQWLARIEPVVANRRDLVFIPSEEGMIAHGWGWPCTGSIVTWTWILGTWSKIAELQVCHLE